MAPDPTDHGERLVRLELGQQHLAGYIESEKATHKRDVDDIRETLAAFTADLRAQVRRIENAIQGTNAQGEPIGLVHDVDVLKREQREKAAGQGVTNKVAGTGIVVALVEMVGRLFGFHVNPP